MTVRQLITLNAQCVSPTTSLTIAAQLMHQLNIGALPVCEKDELSGIITDRDIVLRAVAPGQDPKSTTVNDAMSLGIVYIYEDQEAEEAAKTMEHHQIRQIPVLNRDQRLVGIISLGDLAVETESQLSGEILKEVSSPSTPSR